jgi:hypothetical protein
VSDAYLLLYIPLVIVIMLVLEICRHDAPKEIVRRALWNSAILTAVLGGGSLALHFFNKYF